LGTDFKQNLIAIARSIGLIKLVDIGLFNYSKLKNYSRNKAFKKDNASIVLPPDYMMYESFQVNYNSYYFDSIKSAQGIIELARPYVDFKKASVLDWGCGPGRIVRHLPAIVPDSKIYGSDYNGTSINWCKSNIEGVHFVKNELAPPLAFSDSQFNYIYGISIFTHLSEEMHNKWIDELHRVLAKGGVLMLTTHGDSFLKKLTKKEMASYANGELTIRGNTVEGHRSYVAFHPEPYFRKLVSKFKILAFSPGDINALKPQQDVWVLRKP
jgi:ubiquinone/menaquinone biosynthesis C-methylase UbiE